jgi:hypothetical protein
VPLHSPDTGMQAQSMTVIFVFGGLTLGRSVSYSLKKD